MRFVSSLAISAFIVFTTGVQPSPPKLGTPVSIQDRYAVQTLYGSPVSEVYRTPENLMVTASFAQTGNLCQAGIRSGNGAEITDKDLNAVLDRLAPKEVRGEFKMGTFLNITCLKPVKPKNPTSNSNENPTPKLEVDPCAECSGVSEDYEQVKITKYGNTNRYSSVQITFKQPECEESEKVHP
jgi:hypothetical protein